MRMSLEKKINTLNEEKDLERLIFADHLAGLYEQLRKDDVLVESVNILFDFIYSAKQHSIGESKTSKYFSTAEAFNFVINSLNSSEAMLEGFDNSLNELINIINKLKEHKMTEQEKLKIMTFVQNLIENISNEEINVDERNYFDW